VESFAAARAQFDSVMSGIDFTEMFASRRLRTESGLLTAMSSIRATMNAVQLYRSREMAIEAAHPDMEVSEQERVEVARAVDSLLSSMDAAYGLLLSQYGRFRLANGSMLFTDPAAEQEYVAVDPHRATDCPGCGGLTPAPAGNGDPGAIGTEAAHR
jgi:hypothetical protein